MPDAYKDGSRSPAGKEAAVSREASQLEARLKESRVPDALHDGFWDLWVVSPPRAYDLIGRLATVRTKAAPGMQQVELPVTLAQALGQARVKQGDEALRLLLMQAAQAEPMAPSKGQKATRPTNPADQVFQSMMQSLTNSTDSTLKKRLTVER